MSFSSEQKESIVNTVYKSVCCRSALLSGVLFSKGQADGKRVSVSLEKVEYCELVARLVREFYGKDAEILRSDDGGRRLILNFESKSAANYISQIGETSELCRQKCAGCMSAFLRGVYLAAGRASDPASQYTLEFSLGERSEIFSNFLEQIGPVSKISERKNGKSVYMRDSSMIEYFYALAGMNKAMFTLIDARAEGELRRNVERISNCEMNNIQKAIDAASPQVKLITALEEANLLSSLPEELEQTARLRLMYPDYSLTQLAQASVTSISKPGLSHRLKKIMEIGEQLLNKR